MIKLPYRGSMWQRTDDGLWPTASKELSPSVHHSWGHEASQQSYEWAWKWILTQLSLEMRAASAIPLLQLWTDPKAKNSTKLFPEPSNTNSEVVHIINHDLLSNLLCHNTKYSFLCKKRCASQYYRWIFQYCDLQCFSTPQFVFFWNTEKIYNPTQGQVNLQSKASFCVLLEACQH